MTIWTKKRLKDNKNSQYLIKCGNLYKPPRYGLIRLIYADTAAFHKEGSRCQQYVFWYRGIRKQGRHFRQSLTWMRPHAWRAWGASREYTHQDCSFCIPACIWCKPDDAHRQLWCRHPAWMYNKRWNFAVRPLRAWNIRRNIPLDDIQGDSYCLWCPYHRDNGTGNSPLAAGFSQ